MWMAKQMGHTDWTMIARVYDRWMPSADIDAGLKAEKFWSPDQADEGSKYVRANSRDQEHL